MRRSRSKNAARCRAVRLAVQAAETLDAQTAMDLREDHVFRRMRTMISSHRLALAVTALLTLPSVASAAPPHDFSIYAIRMGGDAAQAKPYVDRFARHLETVTGWPAASSASSSTGLDRPIVKIWLGRATPAERSAASRW